MGRYELAIEQSETTGAQPRNQMRECNLGCIPGPAEHGFAEKGATKGNAIKPAHQFSIGPCFDTVRLATCVQQRNRRLNLVIDPCSRPVFCGLRAHRNNLAKGPIRGCFIPPGAQGPGQ
jgi:hypothetical protein